MNIKQLSAVIELGPKFRSTGTFDVLLDANSDPYILPIFPNTKIEDGFHWDCRIYFEPSETSPDPLGGAECRTHPKVLSLKDGNWVRIGAA
jgi:hypothetical protein